MIQELGRFVRGEAFDEQPMPELDSEAIDFRGASESFAAARKLVRRDLETVEEAIAFVTKHGLHGAELGAVRRKDRWSLPPLAVREAVIHAVVHRDYAQGLAAPVFEELATRFRVTVAALAAPSATRSRSF